MTRFAIQIRNVAVLCALALVLSARAGERLASLSPATGAGIRQDSKAGNQARSLATPVALAVSDEIAMQAREFFDRGASFYIYLEPNAPIWRGQGLLEGRIRYVKNPDYPHESVKVYAFTQGRGIYGERRRIAVFNEPSFCRGLNGELPVIYKGEFRSSSMFHRSVMTVYGKTMLHVVLYPGNIEARALPFGLPQGYISNELLIPADLWPR
ncbi:MAG: hypothetical protein FJ388_08770 [Verrucomicrobia bacterium]|nr:hypothetical protein [Verrucomicrobiota bacterium]